jgi:predicted dehydrogenase
VLEAGKHVHVNKTMTTTVREADELIAFAEARDLRIVASPGEILKAHLTP